MARGKVGAPRKITPEKVLKAIPGSAGIIKCVSDQIGVDRDYMSNWFKRPENAELWARMQRERDTLIDTAESNMKEFINTGDQDATKWYLARIARHRGYGDKQEIKIDGKQEISLTGDGAKELIEALRKKKN